MMNAANRRRLASLWTALVIAYFLWEANGYRGLYRMLAELQIKWFGWYVPMLTFTLLAIVFILPAVLIALYRKRRRRDAGTMSDSVATPMPVELTRTRIMQILFALGAGLVFAGGCVSIWATFGLPRATGTPQTLALGPTAPSFPQVGLTRLTDPVSVGRIALFGQWWPRTARETGYAPIFGHGDNTRVIHYFIQLTPDELQRQPPSVDIGNRIGVLARRDMPGTILALYRGAGYTIDSNFYTLYTSDAALRLRYDVLALQFALSGLVALLLGLWQHRYIRKIRRTMPVAAVA